VTIYPRLSLMVLALTTLGASYQANAAIVTAAPSTGSSSFLFFAYDGAGKSYLQGLNLTLDGMLAAPTTMQSFSLAGLSAQFASSITDPVWGVVAADTVSPGTFRGYRIITSADTAFTAASFPTTNSGTKNSALALANFLNTADDGTAVAGVTIQTSSTSDQQYAGQSSWSFNWGNNGPANTSALTNGAQLAAWLLDTGTSTSGVAKPAKTQLSNWQLDLGSNQLVYAPSAVPVPAAIWMLGSALVALTGIRRRA
jgi:hypothetical protein